MNEGHRGVYFPAMIKEHNQNKQKLGGCYGVTPASQQHVSFLFFSPLPCTTNWTSTTEHTRTAERSVHLCTWRWVDLTAEGRGGGREGVGCPNKQSAPPFWQRGGGWRQWVVVRLAMCLPAGGTSCSLRRPQGWRRGRETERTIPTSGSPYGAAGTPKAPSTEYTPSLLTLALPQPFPFLKRHSAPNLSRPADPLPEAKNLCYSATFWETRGRFLTMDLLNWTVRIQVNKTLPT